MSVVTYIVFLSVVFLCAAIGHHMNQSVDPATTETRKWNASRKYVNMKMKKYNSYHKMSL